MPYDIDGYITTIDTDKIDSDYMNSRFEKYLKILHAEGADAEELRKAEEELHKTFATLSQEEQKFANIFLHDIQSGDIVVVQGKTFKEYVIEYCSKAKDDQIHRLPDGLNWVKIGDAPSQGRYITKTAEKIKPEGLSKTRQVQPGDLILSNSMSFGKPYIMGINGCIHDGWLLIRDTQNRFDLKFLCHMLGTDQMLNQYRMFAAGSTVNNLNKELVGNTTVSLPSVGEQRVIGEYLESVDDLITLQQCKS